nr:hypothetical protein [Paenibacillus pabuli]
MAAKTDAHVHLETVEEAENAGGELAKAGDTGLEGLPVGNTRLGYWRVVGSSVLTCSITNKKLARAGYYDFPARYEHLRKLHLND